ncbi:MAG: CerR family C-terminal domain-containing protein [Burkholderiaceae bacterium]
MPSRGSRADGDATLQANTSGPQASCSPPPGTAEDHQQGDRALAQVDLASINYHFGNRNGLYQAVLTEAHHRLIDLADLRQLAEGELPPTSKLKVLIEQLVRLATSEPQSWHLRVLAREVLAPTSHLQVLFQNEALPKMVLVKRLLSEITAMPADDPVLTRCLLSVAAPCLMLLVGGRTFPGPMQEIFQMSPEAIASHLYHFALGGLQAIADDHKKQPKS